MWMQVLDLAVIGAMGAAGYGMYRLHVRIESVRSSQSGLGEAITALSDAVDSMQKAMGRTVQDASETAKDLGEKIDRADDSILRAARLGTSLDEKIAVAQVLKDDLTVMGPSLERIADRLQGLANEAREAATMASAVRQPAVQEDHQDTAEGEEPAVERAEETEMAADESAPAAQPDVEAEVADDDDAIVAAGIAEAREEIAFSSAPAAKPYLHLVRRV